MVISSFSLCIPGLTSHGHFDAMMTPVSSTMRMPTTVNCRRRYALRAPRTASATFCIAGVPVSAAYTSFMSLAA